MDKSEQIRVATFILFVQKQTEPENYNTFSAEKTVLRINILPLLAQNMRIKPLAVEHTIETTNV